MYLSDRDIKTAIKAGRLIVTPTPDDEAFSPDALDLRLDTADAAVVWNIQKFIESNKSAGHPEKEISLGKFKYEKFSSDHLDPVPRNKSKLVYRRNDDIIVKKGGFLVWKTLEKVGTHEGSKLMCFINGKSTLARMGLLVHLTAPIIHTSWIGQIFLEITNVGEFEFVLRQGDRVVQITVAEVSSPPDKPHTSPKTSGQAKVSSRKSK